VPLHLFLLSTGGGDMNHGSTSSIEHPVGRTLGASWLISGTGLRAEEVRHRRDRQGNQDRQHHALFGGPASAYGVIGKAIAAYFKMVNEQGGINGRKINFISGTTTATARRRRSSRRASSSSRTKVLLLFNRWARRRTRRSIVHEPEEGAAAVRGHRRDQVGRSEELPVDDGLAAELPDRGRRSTPAPAGPKPNAKIAILYQNDDYGKDYLKGFKDGLGAKAASMIVKQVTYEVTDPTIDSQMVTLKATGADTFFNITTPKFAAQAIKKAAEIGWKPVHYLNSVSASVGSVMTPAGLDNGIGSSPLGTSRTRPTAVAEGQGVGRLHGLVEEVRSRRRHQGPEPRVRLHRQPGPGAGAEAGG
jgi:hypothetical protein